MSTKDVLYLHCFCFVFSYLVVLPSFSSRGSLLFSNNLDRITQNWIGKKKFLFVRVDGRQKIFPPRAHLDNLILPCWLTRYVTKCNQAPPKKTGPPLFSLMPPLRFYRTQQNVIAMDGFHDITKIICQRHHRFMWDLISYLLGNFTIVLQSIQRLHQ